jgi:hypothetical protein
MNRNQRDWAKHLNTCNLACTTGSRNPYLSFKNDYQVFNSDYLGGSQLQYVRKMIFVSVRVESSDVSPGAPHGPDHSNHSP